MEQLVPSPGERVRELRRVRVEPPGDLFVGGVGAQRQVGGQHHRGVLLRGVVRVRHGARAAAVLRLPLLGACWTLGQLPFVAEQRVEEAIVPGDRRGRPGALEAARDGVLALTGPVRALPAETLVMNGATLGLRPDALRIAGTVSFAEG